MELRNCSRCGKLFVYKGSSLCPECQKLDEEDFSKVKDYLYDNPGASLIEVSEATGVSSDKILRYLKEGKLELSSEQSGILKCERCGKPIRAGRFCDVCAAEISKGLKRGLEPPRLDNSNRVKGNEKLHIEDRIRSRINFDK